jgi:hypothetical protein
VIILQDFDKWPEKTRVFFFFRGNFCGLSEAVFSFNLMVDYAES